MNAARDTAVPGAILSGTRGTLLVVEALRHRISSKRSDLMFDKSHDISVLNSLIETTIDSVDGYRRSAQEATNSRFSAAFLERANEREQIVSKLRDEVRRLGGNPEDDGSVLAAAHRAFLSLRDKVTGSDDAAVIAEVDHGESYLNGKWETALRDDQLSQETRSLIQQSYDSVREGRDTFRRLHEDMSSTSGAGTSTSY
jgi:uncharacterized protein (TIGR02284 family)